MTSLARGVGNMLHSQSVASGRAVPSSPHLGPSTRWRAFSNERRTAQAHGFVDGDVVESFLDLPPEKMVEVGLVLGWQLQRYYMRARAFQVAGKLGMKAEDVLKQVDDMSRWH